MPFSTRLSATLPAGMVIVFLGNGVLLSFYSTGGGRDSKLDRSVGICSGGKSYRYFENRFTILGDIVITRTDKIKMYEGGRNGCLFLFAAPLPQQINRQLLLYI